jgi:hypothetical protein
MATPTAPREIPRKYRTTQVRVPNVKPAAFQEDPTAAGLDLLQQSLLAVGDHFVEEARVRQEEGLFDLDVALKERFVEGVFEEDEFVSSWNSQYPENPIDGLGTRATSQVSLFAGKSQGYANIQALREGIANNTITNSEDLAAARAAQMEALEAGGSDGMHKLGAAEESRTGYDELELGMFASDAKKAKIQQQTSAVGRMSEVFTEIFTEDSTPGVTVATADKVSFAVIEVQEGFAQADDPQGEMGNAVLGAATQLLFDKDNMALGDDLIETIDGLELIQTTKDRKAWATLKKTFYTAREAANNAAGTAAENKAARAARKFYSKAARANEDGLLTQENEDDAVEKFGSDIADLGRALWQKTQTGKGSYFSSTGIVKEAEEALGELDHTNNSEAVDDLVDTKEKRTELRELDPDLYAKLEQAREDNDTERPTQRKDAMEDWKNLAEEGQFFDTPEELHAWDLTVREKMALLPVQDNQIYSDYAEQEYNKLLVINKQKLADAEVLKRSPAKSWQTQVHIDAANEELTKASEALTQAQDLWDAETSFGEDAFTIPDPIFGTKIQAVMADDAEEALKALERAKADYLKAATKATKLIKKQNKQLRNEKRQKGQSPPQVEFDEYHNGPNESVDDYDFYSSEGDF